MLSRLTALTLDAATKNKPSEKQTVENVERLQPPSFDGQSVEVAVALGLDESRFVSELAGHVHAARVREDFMGGVRSGVNGTPTFFVNDRRHDGPYDLDSLLEAVEVEIAAANGTD